MKNDPFGDLVGLEEAAIYADFTTRHLRLLLHHGKIKGRTIGRDWITTKEEIDKYLSLTRKPGRKPKYP